MLLKNIFILFLLFIININCDNENPKRCSKKLGETCKYNCECCGATVVCDDNICKSKTSNNAILDTIGQGMNVMINVPSLLICA